MTPFADLLAGTGRRGDRRAARAVRVHGVPRWGTRGDDRRDRGRGGTAERRVALRGRAARRHARPPAVDQRPPGRVARLRCVRRPRRRGRHDPRLRAAGAVRVAPARWTQPSAGRARRSRRCVGHCRPTTSSPISSASHRISVASTPTNPVNLCRGGGVQIELPPRVRGASPMWWDWEGPGLTPHTLRSSTGWSTPAT